MTRALLVIAGLFLALLATITIARRGGESEGGSDLAEDAERTRVRSFWEQYHRATEARTAGDFEGAADLYRAALELDPDHQDSLFYLAACLQETGRYREAVAALRTLTETHPEYNPGFTQLGTILFLKAPGAEPDFEAAAAALRRSEEINPEHSGPFVRQGQLELARGQLERAADYFSIGAEAGAPEATFLAGLSRYFQGRYPEAAALFTRVLQTGAREKAITGRGVLSEGDVQGSGDEDALTAIERSGILALVFLSWTSERLGGYPADVPASFHVDLQSRSTAFDRFATAPFAGNTPGRGIFVDPDGDGRLDLILTGLPGTRLLGNERGGWRDRTGEAGLRHSGPSWDACTGDFNADGALDLYVLGGGYVGQGPNRLLQNEGGRFRDVTEAWGLGGDRPTSRAIALDADGDGRADVLEVGNAAPASRPVRLYLNRGRRFEERAEAWGLDYPTHLVDVASADIDRDGLPDVFLLGWKVPARLYRNTGSGFADVTADARLSGVGGDGLSALFFDFDRDGDQDLLVTAHAPLTLSLRRLLAPETPSKRYASRLFANRGDGRFEEVTAAVGLDRAFGVVEARAADFDGDGWPDLLFAHGGLEATHLEPSVILRNESGRSFREWAYLPSIRDPRNGTGAAVADVDGDGRMDVFLAGAGLLMQKKAHPNR